MITIEEKRENFRRWWKKYIKIYSKEFILEHLEGIAETIFNSVLNCDIKIFDIDFWHYPSQGELSPRGEQVLCWLWNGNYVLAFIREDDEWTTNGKNAFDGVKCWQYIIPPKEQRMTENLKSCPLINDKHKDTGSAVFGTPKNEVTSE